MTSLTRKLLLDYYLGGTLQAALKPLVVLLGRLLHRNHRLEDCREITFLKLLGGGSLVIAYPALLALRQSGRFKRLRLVATEKTAPFGQVLGVFDEILIVGDEDLPRLLGDSLHVLRTLSRTDAVVDLEIHSRLSTVFCLLTRAKNRIGAYTEDSFWRRDLATHLLFYNKFGSIFGLYDQIAGLFNAPVPPFAQCIETFRATLAKTGKPKPQAAPQDVAIAPCCSDLSRERMLREEDWPTVLERFFTGHPAPPPAVHLIGGKGDREFLETFTTLVHRASPTSTVVNHAGLLSLQESVALVGSVGRLLCVDSAMLHFARLQGVPTVSYWGPTNPATYLRPSADANDEVHYTRIGCSPCVHLANVAPCKGHNVCMKFAVDPQCGLNPNPTWLAQDPLARKEPE